MFFVKGEPPAGVPAHPSGFYPATRAMTMEEYHAGYSPDSPQGSVFLDILDKKGVEVASGLSVVIMNYMDAVSMDIAAPARVLHDGDGARRARHPVLLVPSDRFRRAARVPAVVQRRTA